MKVYKIVARAKIDMHLNSLQSASKNSRRAFTLDSILAAKVIFTSPHGSGSLLNVVRISRFYGIY